MINTGILIVIYMTISTVVFTAQITVNIIDDIARRLQRYRYINR